MNILDVTRTEVRISLYKFTIKLESMLETERLLLPLPVSFGIMNSSSPDDVTLIVASERVVSETRAKLKGEKGVLFGSIQFTGSVKVMENLPMDRKAVNQRSCFIVNQYGEAFLSSLLAQTLHIDEHTGCLLFVQARLQAYEDVVE